MPTENRSSNTEMVSVPREWLNSVALLQMPLDELQEQAIQHLCDPCDEPAPQPHPEPIAWMVGTAFWWTKEEAERDAAETGLQIVGLGPMTDRTATELAESETMAAIAELAECEAMADMVAEREWAEHVGTGDVSSKVEAAFTQLHNDLHEAGEMLAERDSLLDRVVDHAKFWHDHPYAEVVEGIAKDYKALSASAGPSSPTWSCQACQVEQPTDRACDACGGKTELAGAKS
ncbi:hypothetical protein [Pseudomonas sp. NBRC 111131]|uniref:hypothetical protein n=1 Tax=Pseudomonas sp. NBRC 111131 TaxID=1661046 RepID=UPI0009E8F82E|nr:hypothetical protein [Pseudomonas sp. NBRC 111131]